MKYPYLGIKFDENDKRNVVFFTSENTGAVVLDETEQEGCLFGTNGKFNEDDYDFLPAVDSEGNDICVRLQN